MLTHLLRKIIAWYNKTNLKPKQQQPAHKKQQRNRGPQVKAVTKESREKQAGHHNAETVLGGPGHVTAALQTPAQTSRRLWAHHW